MPISVEGLTLRFSEDLSLVDSLETSMLKIARDQFAKASGSVSFKDNIDVAERPAAKDWLIRFFPNLFSDHEGGIIPFAKHHDEFWSWVESLSPGVPVPAFFGLWGRGGGKSTNTEAACAYVAKHGMRKYGLYVSGTQDQADNHVSSVATLLENPALGIERAVGKYGNSKGWRRNRLRTSSFTLDAIGLDTASRGTKWDEARPDFLVVDDVDDSGDSSTVIRRKEMALTRKILPAGSDDMAIIGVQNIPNADGIFAKIADGRADFLMDRVISGPFPALSDFVYETYYDKIAKRNLYRIIKGQPVWDGQSVEKCEVLLNRIGLRSFQVECLFEKDRSSGDMFQREWFKIVDDWPRDAKLVRYWDLASTDERPGSDPDYTAGCLMAMKNGQFWLVDMKHFRGNPLKVETLIRQTAELDGQGVEIYIEQEGGASGKHTIHTYQKAVLVGFSVQGVRSTGSKSVRAKPVSSAAEAGNVMIVRGFWNQEFLDEIEEVFGGLHDDQCFVAGTNISTDRGCLSIELVKPGDKVMTRKGWQKVLRSGQTGFSKSFIEIKAKGGVTLTSTPNHPIWVYEKGFIPASKIKKEDDLYRAPIQELRHIETEKEQPVYNLQIENAHEFFANGILVHNCDAMSGAHMMLSAPVKKKRAGTWGR